jgi:hypothetical protein
MKTITLLLILFPVFAFAEVSLQDCLDDARTFANHERPVAPLIECADIINTQEDKIEVTAGPFRIYGKNHLIYVDKRDAVGNVIERTLLSGDQTDLVAVKKIFVDLVDRKLFVIQQNQAARELLVFNLDFLGNVTPLNVMKSTALLTNVSSVKAADEKNIEVINAQGTWLVNSDAESRASRSVKVALSIRPK